VGCQAGLQHTALSVGVYMGLNTSDAMRSTGTAVPLTRADVEKLLQTVESTDKLDLSGQNMRGINLSELTDLGRRK